MKINIKVFFVLYKLVVLFLPVITRPAQSTKNSKFASYEVDVLYADKHKSLLQVDSIIFDGFGQACPKYSDKFAIPL